MDQQVGVQPKKISSFFYKHRARAAEVAISTKDSKKKEEEIYEQIPWVEPQESATPEHLRSIPEFIKELGWLPFGFLLGVSLFSKEILFFEPDVMGFHTVFLTGSAFYFMTADMLEEMYRDTVKEKMEREQNVWDLLSVSLKERVAIHKADIATEDFVKDLAHHWKASEIEAARYGSLKAKHDARNEILAQLEGIARKEKAVQAAGTKVVANALREHVRQQWLTPDPQLKEQAFSLALNNLLNPQPIDPKASPVYGLYLNYLRGNAKPTQKARA